MHKKAAAELALTLAERALEKRADWQDTLGATMRDVVHGGSQWFQSLSPEARNAIIGGVVGGGMGGVSGYMNDGSIIGDAATGAALGGALGGAGTAAYKALTGPQSSLTPEQWKDVNKAFPGGHPLLRTLAYTGAGAGGGLGVASHVGGTLNRALQRRTGLNKLVTGATDGIDKARTELRGTTQKFVSADPKDIRRQLPKEWEEKINPLKQRYYDELKTLYLTQVAGSAGEKQLTRPIRQRFIDAADTLADNMAREHNDSTLGTLSQQAATLRKQLTEQETGNVVNAMNSELKGIRRILPFWDRMYRGRDAVGSQLVNARVGGAMKDELGHLTAAERGTPLFHDVAKALLKPTGVAAQKGQIGRYMGERFGPALESMISHEGNPWMKALLGIGATVGGAAGLNYAIPGPKGQ